MALYKIKDFYPDYREHFGDHDVMGYDLYSGTDKVGSVDNLLVDDEGRFRYLIINTGAWIFGKKVLLPIGRARIDYNDRHVYVDGLTREQVENLPEYDGSVPADFDYEERVRGVYRSPSSGTSMGTGAMAAGAMGSTAAASTNPINTATPLDTPTALTDVSATSDVSRRDVVADRDVSSSKNPIERAGDAIGNTVDRVTNRDSYRYDEHDRDLYALNDQHHQTLRLYEERLIANKQRQRTGEVIVGKHVETEQTQVNVPIERERVVIERTTPVDRVVSGTDVNAFNEGDVVRMEVYEEVPDIRKETVLREEVTVRKEVDRDTVTADETIRRERLDIDKDGNPNINNTDLPNV
ncbi:DUF2382 domain-containing protein [Leptolyngbya sp. FACHB-711]|uniref:DUF2382 domain-containing protein n=1 Tax=unclassified Leptolyngbya TaxID=2650499 RepID=UPI0016846BF5|nr:DUF2382 domain-containing protein [Leptolyngbya sp. FACHB-711]MBD1851897.1 DUF2382 domain-containing protein [Cyanobacteria bacterium FACHB-502]MBD2022889.1 DUF2382 domain-containing protein [Leptolyngbya sp. FACHB-711]